MKETEVGSEPDLSFERAMDQLWTMVLATCRRIGRRPGRCVLGFAVAAFLGSSLVGTILGPPVAEVHDEFAYLLAGDTFARGRLTNPPHPHWVFLETFHVLQQPTYSSKYPPGQGVSLAIGQVLADAPFVGVWLGVALAAGAVTWALLGSLPTHWAVLSSVFFAVQLCWIEYWAQSYWGGALAAAGGALALGAFVRLRRAGQWYHGLILGVGFGLMAVTRPMEGLLLAAVLSGFLLERVLRDGPSARLRLLLRGFAPAAVVVGLTLGGVAVHNRAVTGSPLTMPYSRYQADYSASPLFLFERAGPVGEYRHETIERYFREWSIERHESIRDGFPRKTAEKLGRLLLFFLGPGVIALLALGKGRPDGVAGVALTASIVVVGISLLTKGTFPHYVAPIAVAFYVLMGRGLARLHRRARVSGRMDWSFVAGFLLIPSLALRFPEADPPDSFPTSKTRIEQSLAGSGGPDVVFVAYDEEEHNVHEEWVYNGAEVDEQEVVWARSMGPTVDRVLMGYYPERTAWLVTVSETARIEAYPGRAHP